jgi:2-dehydro-3-deoxyphosphogluconate aldolase/(4S)-4-hydroxy-2-oxoglutarate aldolase
MSKTNSLERVVKSGLVAIIRAPSSEKIVSVARALAAGGIDVIEVTFTVPGALDVLKDVHEELGDEILLGAGTVLDAETARAAILAGAQFIVTPTLRPDVIQLCRRYDKLCMPGAYTPTEILTAWEAGGDIVKVFPADIGGPRYLKTLQGPLPQVPLMPTGGVNLETLGEFLAAGACAVGLGGALVEPAAERSGDMQRIQEQAARFVEAIAAFRRSTPSG